MPVSFSLCQVCQLKEAFGARANGDCDFYKTLSVLPTVKFIPEISALCLLEDAIDFLLSLVTTANHFLCALCGASYTLQLNASSSKHAKYTAEFLSTKAAS